MDTIHSGLCHFYLITVAGAVSALIHFAPTSRLTLLYHIAGHLSGTKDKDFCVNKQAFITIVQE